MQDREMYAKILGIETPWKVTDVQLDMQGQEIRIHVTHTGNADACPECGGRCPRYDLAPERRWRHLDTCQLRTVIVSRTPRIDCPAHGARTVNVPWAAPHGRFTLFMEWLCIQWLLACRKQSQVAQMLRISADELRHIMHRAVERGLRTREQEPVPALGIDEKSMKKGHHYLTVLSDTESGKVLDVAEGRTETAATQVLNTLSDIQKQTVESVSMDMWPAFMTAVEQVIPDAARVHDRYHVSAHLNVAVDQTRRHEYKRLSEAEQAVLKGTRYLFLRNYCDVVEQQTEARFMAFAAAARVARQTAKAWHLKEAFRGFWTQPDRASASDYLRRWVALAREQKLPALTRVATMLETHATGLLAYIDHRVTNAVAEMLNGKIQELKFAARGFRSFAHYRTHILFHLGRLDLNPLKTQ